MADTKAVVCRFITLGKRSHTAGLFDGVDGIAPAGEDFVRIALVADIPDDAVIGRVIQPVQRSSQLDHAQPGSKMPAAFSH